MFTLVFLSALVQFEPWCIKAMRDCSQTTDLRIDFESMQWFLLKSQICFLCSTTWGPESMVGYQSCSFHRDFSRFAVLILYSTLRNTVLELLNDFLTQSLTECWASFHLFLWETQPLWKTSLYPVSNQLKSYLFSLEILLQGLVFLLLFFGIT